MPKHDDFPIWTRNRARRHAARGCSHLVVGLILRPDRRRLSGSTAQHAPSNVLPFRIPEAVRRHRSAPAFEGDLRHG